MDKESNYKEKIKSIAVAAIKTSKADRDLDVLINESCFLRNKESYLDALTNSDNPNAIFELGVFPLLIEQNALNSIFDFYQYATYYAIYQDVTEQIELLEVEIAKN